MRLQLKSVTISVIIAAMMMPNFGFAANLLFTPRKSSQLVTLDGLFKNHIFPDTQFLTFSPDVEAIGPVVGAGSLEDYYRLIFRHILRQADLKIHNDPVLGYHPGTNDNFSYYTFLLLALAIPQHESRGVHFRQVGGVECDQQANDLISIGPGARQVLSPIYRDPLRPLLPDCRYIKSAPLTHQLLFAPSGDIGIMQMNVRFHPAEMDPTILMNVFRSIDGGIDYIWSGYDQLDDKKGKISCIRPTDPFDRGYAKLPWGPGSKPAIWLSLAQASWSHSYNGQSLCSYNVMNENNRGFYRDIMSIINGTSLYQSYLPEGTIERAALDELVYDFQGAFSRQLMTEKNAAIKAILHSSETPYATWRMPKRTLVAPTHFLKRGRISIYSQPDSEPQNACGYLASGGHGAERVRVLTTTLGQDARAWGRIELPEFVTFAHIASQVKMLELKKGYFASPIRSAPTIDSNGGPSTYIRTISRYPNGGSPVFTWVTTLHNDGLNWDEMIDDRGAVVYANAGNFETFYKPIAPTGACSANNFYVRMADLTKLPPSYVEGKNYLGVIIGKGLLNLMSENRRDATIANSLSPGTLVFVVGSKNNGFGELWYRVLVHKTDTNVLWAPAARVQILRAIKSKAAK